MDFVKSDDWEMSPAALLKLRVLCGACAKVEQTDLHETKKAMLERLSLPVLQLVAL